jgi:prepilin-type N-terminal cleavage/methylation domain-containing protein
MKQNRKAFTIIELVVVVLLIGIFSYVAIPRMRSGILDQSTSQTQAQKIITDLRLARNMAVTDAARNTSGFAVQMTGSSPYRSYNVVNLTNNSVVSTVAISSNASCTGGASFKFGPLGNLLAGSGNQLVVSGGGRTTIINIVAATGTVEYVQN